MLVLFGTDFLGLKAQPSTAVVAVHLVGLGLAVWAAALAIRRFPRDTDRVAQILLIAIVASVTALAFSGRSGPPGNGRYIAPMLPSAAVLAGRVLAGRLISARLLPLMGVALLGYVAALGHAAVQPPVATTSHRLAEWLVAHHLDYGLSSYERLGSTITVITGQRVQIRPIQPSSSGLGLGPPIETQASWYDPHLHNADFVIIPARPIHDSPPDPTLFELRAAFGAPIHTYRVDATLVLFYGRNLLPEVHQLKSYGYGG